MKCTMIRFFYKYGVGEEVTVYIRNCILSSFKRFFNLLEQVSSSYVIVFWLCNIVFFVFKTF